MSTASFKKKLAEEIAFYNNVLANNDYKAMGKAFNVLHPKPHGKYCAVAKKREDAIASYNAGYSTKSRWAVQSCADGSCGDVVGDNTKPREPRKPEDNLNPKDQMVPFMTTYNACGCTMGVDGLLDTPSYDGDVSPNDVLSDATLYVNDTKKARANNFDYRATGTVKNTYTKPGGSLDDIMDYTNPNSTYMNGTGPTATSPLRGKAKFCIAGRPSYIGKETGENKEWNNAVCAMRRDDRKGDKEAKQDLRRENKGAKIAGKLADANMTNAGAQVAASLLTTTDPNTITAVPQGNLAGAPPTDTKDNTWLYVGVGAGVLGIATILFFVLRKRK